MGNNASVVPFKRSLSIIARKAIFFSRLIGLIAYKLSELVFLIALLKTDPTKQGLCGHCTLSQLSKDSWEILLIS